MVMGDNRSFSSPMSPRQLLWPELLLRFDFETLVMNRARSLIGSADLPRDLLAERHAGYKMRRVHRLIEGRGLPRPGRHNGRPNTGEPSPGDQSITRGAGGGLPLPPPNVPHAALFPAPHRPAFRTLHPNFPDYPHLRFPP